MMVRRATITVATIIVFVLGGHAANALEIVSSKSGEVFLEGQSVKIVAELSPDDPDDILYVNFETTGGIDKCPDEISSLPLECTFVIPLGSPSRIEISATGATVEGAVSSPSVTIFVGLPPTVTLQGLKSGLGNYYSFSMLGQNRQLYISGLYSDGVDRDVEGTTYVSSDERVVVVDTRGLATAKAVGTAKITVTNGPHKLVIDVEVEDIVKPRKKR
ncbi:MAG: Ig-like domain-containing protein [Nitrospirae bacterium]|nr:Ig-like domain-containing protein [Nitrospirota bacterium]